MSETANPATRRTIILGAAMLTGLPLLATPKRAVAAGVPQAAAKYQTMPKGAFQCSTCTYYVPGASATAAGTCKVVAGAILPTGWCQLYAKKPA